MLLWRRLERTRRLLGGQCKRYCIRNILKAWFGSEATDDFIWEVCRLSEQEGWNELPIPRPINVNKKGKRLTPSPSLLREGSE